MYRAIISTEEADATGSANGVGIVHATISVSAPSVYRYATPLSCSAITGKNDEGNATIDGTARYPDAIRIQKAGDDFESYQKD